MSRSHRKYLTEVVDAAAAMVLSAVEDAVVEVRDIGRAAAVMEYGDGVQSIAAASPETLAGKLGLVPDRIADTEDR